jgi:hypothetical protein
LYPTPIVTLTLTLTSDQRLWPTLRSVGYYFDGDPENGGQWLLIALNRCQAFKIAQKSYRGKGGVRVAKGDCLLTDCNVTGTDIGTPGKPKFALKTLWEYDPLPALDALVGPGEQCEGALVIHQEDNAGSILTNHMTLTLTLTLTLNLYLTQTLTYNVTSP